MAGKSIFQCIVPGCYNTRSNYPNMTFYELPRKCERREAWLKSINAMEYFDMTRSQNHKNRICETHFPPGSTKHSETKKLNLTAVPQINPFPVEVEKTHKDNTTDSESNNGGPFIHCIYPRCKNNIKNKSTLTFYELPVNRKRRLEWLIKIRGMVYQNVPRCQRFHIRVCEVHFSPENIENIQTKELKKNAIPLAISHINDKRKSQANIENINKKKVEEKVIVLHTVNSDRVNVPLKSSQNSEPKQNKEISLSSPVSRSSDSLTTPLFKDFESTTVHCEPDIPTADSSHDRKISTESPKVKISNVYPLFLRSPVRSVLRCIVPGCKNTIKNSPNLWFYELPTSNKRRLKWLKSINAMEYANLSRSGSFKYRVCSLHFPAGSVQHSQTKRLNNTAVPLPISAPSETSKEN